MPEHSTVDTVEQSKTPTHPGLSPWDTDMVRKNPEDTGCSVSDGDKCQEKREPGVAAC